MQIEFTGEELDAIKTVVGGKIKIIEGGSYELSQKGKKHYQILKSVYQKIEGGED